VPLVNERLVWIDCEMTGLDLSADALIEVAALVTDFDLNVLGAGRAFVGLGAYAPSDDGNRLAYTIDTTGYRQYVLYVKDLKTGAVSAPMAVRVDGVAWSTDGSTLMYAQEDSVTKRTYLALRQKLGGRAEVVFEEMPCQPCHGYYCEKFAQPECILRVPVTRVTAAIDRVLLS